MDVTTLFNVPVGDWSLTALDTIFANAGIVSKLLTPFNEVIAAGGVLILSYIVVHSVVDMAHSGQPLGRYSEVWFPVRVVMTVGLALPIPPSGFNTAQLLIYQSARLGIGGATAIWNLAVDELGNRLTPIVAPPPADAFDLAHGLYLMNVCRAAANQLAAASRTAPWINEDLVQGKDQTIIAYNGNRELGFGETACGAVVIANPNADTDNEVVANAVDLFAATHFESMVELKTGLQGLADDVVASAFDYSGRTSLPPIGGLSAAIVAYGARIATAGAQLAGAQDQARAARAKAFADEAKAQGWVGAAGFMMQMSRVNGAILQAAGAVPRVVPPHLDTGLSRDAAIAMQRVFSVAEQYWSAHMARTGLDDESDNALLAGSDAPGILAKFGLRASLFRTFVLAKDDLTNPLAALVGMGHSMIAAFWTAFIGLAGVTGVAAGVDTAGGSVTGQVLTLGTSVAAASVAHGTLAIIQSLGWLPAMLLLALLGAGVTYAYILPAMPFIYFFFGIAGWIQRIGIGTLAAPVWAISHLGGEESGAISDNARSGYALLAELFIRPMAMVIAIVFSYVGIYLLVSLFFPYFQKMILSSLAGHVDLFTGAVVYMILGAVLLVGMMHGMFSLVTRATDAILAMANLRGAGDHGDIESHATTVVGGVNATTRRIQDSASATATKAQPKRLRQGPKSTQRASNETASDE